MQGDLVVDEVFFAVPPERLEVLTDALETCESLGVDARVLVDLYRPAQAHPFVEELFGLPFYGFSPTLTRQGVLGAKRVLDVAGAAVLLAVLFPFLVGIGAIIRLTSRGPAIFRQERSGFHGRRFEMYKFRTMVQGAEQLRDQVAHLNEMAGPVFKIADDPRLDGGGPLSSPDQPRRAAPARERRLGRDEPGGTAAVAGLRGEPHQGRSAPAPGDAAGHDRALAGERPKQRGLRRLDAARPALRRPLVIRPRPAHPAPHDSRRPARRRRVLSPARSTATERRLRRRDARVRGEVPAAAALDPPGSFTPRPYVFVGLGSVLLGVPFAVLGTAAGPYDDPKAWALPILVALTGLAWLIQRRERPDGAPDRSGRWLWGIVAAYFLWWIVTTLTSLAPWQSLLGNFGRGLGLLTFGSAILLFPLVRSECRSPRAVRALIDAALLGSAPVCVLALGQALGWDPMPKVWDPAVARLTVRSTFGQHIFLGSYLAALIPIAAARLEWGLRAREPSRPDGDSSSGRRRSGLMTAAWVAGAIGLVALGSRWDLAWWLLVPWGVIGAGGLALVLARSGATPLLPVPVVAGLLATQVIVVVLCQARGAFFGMLAGLSVTAFALLARRRAWRALASVAAVLVAVALFLVLLNVPTSPLAALRAKPLLGRLSHLADVRHGTPRLVPPPGLAGDA